MSEGLHMISFAGKQFPQDIILMAVRWYVTYPLSYRNIEELMAERNVRVDHATFQALKRSSKRGINVNFYPSC